MVNDTKALTDAVPGDEPPRQPRTNLFISARLEWDGGAGPVTVRNLSDSGALVEGAVMPPSGARVRLVRGSLSASGSVAWADERRCGLTLAGGIHPAAWMARPANAGQAAVDQVVHRLRTGDMPLAPMATLAVSSAPTLPQIASAMHKLEADLQQVIDRLMTEPEMVARHPDQLQGLDLVAQGLAQLRERLA